MQRREERHAGAPDRRLERGNGRSSRLRSEPDERIERCHVRGKWTNLVVVDEHAGSRRGAGSGKHHVTHRGYTPVANSSPAGKLRARNSYFVIMSITGCTYAGSL